MATTSLKLPDDVKKLAVAAAKQLGVTPHAFMVDAIRSAATAAEKRAEFVTDALTAREETIKSGEGFLASEVHDYFRSRAQGKPVSKPGAKSWRS